MSSNWLGSRRTRRYIFVVVRPMIHLQGEESIIIVSISKVSLSFTRSLRKIYTYSHWFWHIITSVIESNKDRKFRIRMYDWLTGLFLYYSSSYKIPCEKTGVQALHVTSSLSLRLRGENRQKWDKVRRCRSSKLHQKNGSVTVRRPVPVPFPVLWLLAQNMIDQFTILYFISRVLLVWKH